MLLKYDEGSGLRSSVTVCCSCEQRYDFPRSTKKGNAFLGCVSDRQGEEL
jgi:hypothetical protein